jgi:hypothetical protein
LIFTEGPIYTLDVIRKYGDEFPAGSTKFEVSVTSGRIDVKVGSGADATLYEMKNVSNIPPDKFGQQFYRDMEAATSLSNINWWFNRRKIDNFTEQNKLDMLAEIRLKLEDIPDLQPLFNKYLTNDPQNLNELMNKINASFDSIFKID